MLVNLNEEPDNLYFTYRTHGKKNGLEEDFMIFFEQILGFTKMDTRWYIVYLATSIVEDPFRIRYYKEDGIAFDLVMIPNTKDDILDDSVFDTLKIYKGEKEEFDKELERIYGLTKQILAQSIPEEGADRSSYQDFIVKYDSYINVELPHIKL